MEQQALGQRAWAGVGQAAYQTYGGVLRAVSGAGATGGGVLGAIANVAAPAVMAGVGIQRLATIFGPALGLVEETGALASLGGLTASALGMGVMGGLAVGLGGLYAVGQAKDTSGMADYFRNKDDALYRNFGGWIGAATAELGSIWGIPGAQRNIDTAKRKGMIADIMLRQDMAGIRGLPQEYREYAIRAWQQRFPSWITSDISAQVGQMTLPYVTTEQGVSQDLANTLADVINAGVSPEQIMGVATSRLGAQNVSPFTGGNMLSALGYAGGRFQAGANILQLQQTAGREQQLGQFASLWQAGGGNLIQQLEAAGINYEMMPEQTFQRFMAAAGLTARAQATGQPYNFGTMALAGAGRWTGQQQTAETMWQTRQEGLISQGYYAGISPQAMMNITGSYSGVGAQNVLGGLLSRNMIMWSMAAADTGAIGQSLQGMGLTPTVDLQTGLPVGQERLWELQAQQRTAQRGYQSWSFGQQRIAAARNYAYQLGGYAPKAGGQFALRQIDAGGYITAGLQPTAGAPEQWGGYGMYEYQGVLPTQQQIADIQYDYQMMGLQRQMRQADIGATMSQIRYDYGMARQGLALEGLNLAATQFAEQQQAQGAAAGMQLAHFMQRWELAGEGLRMGQRQFMEQWQVAGERQGIQYGWAQEDLAYARNRSQLQFGWQMEDYQEKIRFATGRQRRQLERERGRAVVSYTMEQGRMDEQEDRLEKQREWQVEDHERQKRFYDENYDLQMRQHNLSKKQAEEQHAQTMAQMALAKEHFDQNQDLQRRNHELAMGEMAALRAQELLLEGEQKDAIQEQIDKVEQLKPLEDGLRSDQIEHVQAMAEQESDRIDKAEDLQGELNTIDDEMITINKQMQGTVALWELFFTTKMPTWFPQFEGAWAGFFNRAIEQMNSAMGGPGGGGGWDPNEKRLWGGVFYGTYAEYMEWLAAQGGGPPPEEEFEEHTGGGEEESYQTGTSYVPATGKYKLHQGEVVIPADRAMRLSTEIGSAEEFGEMIVILRAILEVLRSNSGLTINVRSDEARNGIDAGLSLYERSSSVWRR